MAQLACDIPGTPFPPRITTAEKPSSHGKPVVRLANEVRDFRDILSGAESIWDKATSNAASILHETTKVASLLDKATAVIGSVAAKMKTLSNTLAYIFL
ncbi:hypothetical protein I308_106383 [Cryptococcus tetragattii IND107]|uniref:BLOC-1-related complex subunit 7 n=1 Tax=Cryptococcus tetragattii IND107 TaxID=1296105 RepID=A0ABR3BJ24_9TREE